MTTRRALLLVGSAKAPGKSTSEALARYLGTHLESAGAAVEIASVARGRVADPVGHLAKLTADADLFVLVTPLYVDSLPYLVTRTLESLAGARSLSPLPRSSAFAAIVNCGSPEAKQCQTALDIARAFARAARFEWAGGLALGEGGALNGRRLEDAAGMTRHIRAALDLAAAALAAGRPIPDEAVRRMARPMMPRAAYSLVVNIGWKRQTRRNGVRLDARPFDR